MLLILILYSLGTFSLTKALLTHCTPFFLLGIRMAIAGSALLAYQCWKTRQSWLQRSHAPLYAKIILCAVFVPYCLRYYGLLHAPAARATLLYNLGPIITYAGACVWSVERFAWRTVGALALGLSGLYLFLGIPVTTFFNTPLNLGDLALILAVASLSYGWLIIRTMVVELGYAPAAINAIAMLGGGILGLATAYSFETIPYVTNGTQFALLLTAVIIASNFIAHNVYAALLRTYSLTLLQLGSWMAPVMAGIGTRVWLHQPMTPACVAGALLICSSFVLMYQWECGAREAVNKVQSVLQ